MEGKGTGEVKNEKILAEGQGPFALVCNIVKSVIYLLVSNGLCGTLCHFPYIIIVIINNSRNNFSISFSIADFSLKIDQFVGHQSSD